MIATIKSEFRKVLSVRSTYVIVLICLVLEGIASGYGGGFNAGARELSDPRHLTGEITSMVSLLPVFVALIGILLVTHEYRYNTITYTLTASRSRTRVLVAKLLVMSLLAVVLTAVFALIVPLFVWIGAALNGKHMSHQALPSADLIARMLFTGLAYPVLALGISFITRAQVAALGAYFLIPSILEQVLAGLLKNNQYYLPFISINGVLNDSQFSHDKSMIIAAVWLALGMLAGWVLFTRRDAS
jgi:ABC-2 type transport system permease protein